MTEKRFFILTDAEYNDILCIRDRTSKIKDIYGHYRYDDLGEICNILNELFDNNNSLKESLLLHLDIIDGLNEKIKGLKQQLEDCEFAHRTEMAHHRVVEQELKEKIAKRDYTSQKLFDGDVE